MLCTADPTAFMAPKVNLALVRAAVARRTAEKAHSTPSSPAANRPERSHPQDKGKASAEPLRAVSPQKGGAVSPKETGAVSSVPAQPSTVILEDEPPRLSDKAEGKRPRANDDVDEDVPLAKRVSSRPQDSLDSGWAKLRSRPVDVQLREVAKILGQASILPHYSLLPYTVF